MKLNLGEFKNSFYLKLEAETVEESSMLLRLTNNTKIKPVNIYTSFVKGIISEIYFDKVEIINCNVSFSNKRKIK